MDHARREDALLAADGQEQAFAHLVDHGLGLAPERGDETGRAELQRANGLERALGEGGLQRIGVDHEVCGQLENDGLGEHERSLSGSDQCGSEGRDSGGAGTRRRNQRRDGLGFRAGSRSRIW